MVSARIASALVLPTVPGASYLFRFASERSAVSAARQHRFRAFTWIDIKASIDLCFDV